MPPQRFSRSTSEKLKSDSLSSESNAGEGSATAPFSCSEGLEGVGEDGDIGRRLSGIRVSHEETGVECTEEDEGAGSLDVLSGTEEQVSDCLIREFSFLFKSCISEESFISISFRF